MWGTVELCRGHDVIVRGTVELYGGHGVIVRGTVELCGGHGMTRLGTEELCGGSIRVMGFPSPPLEGRAQGFWPPTDR